MRHTWPNVSSISLIIKYLLVKQIHELLFVDASHK